MRIPSLRRAVPAVLAGAALLLGASACGGGDVDKGALVTKLKSDQFKTATDAQANCVADVMIKYIKADDLKKYIEKGSEPPAPPDDKKEQAVKDIEACGKK